METNFEFIISLINSFIVMGIAYIANEIRIIKQDLKEYHETIIRHDEIVKNHNKEINQFREKFENND